MLSLKIPLRIKSRWDTLRKLRRLLEDLLLDLLQSHFNLIQSLLGRLLILVYLHTYLIYFRHQSFFVFQNFLLDDGLGLLDVVVFLVADLEG